MATTFQAGKQAPKVQVMVLGTYHMDNPGLDYIKAELDDHLSSKRQTEIADVVDRLAAFKPDKIAVEAVFGQSTINAKYAKYLRSEYTLSVDERDQIAMRLAKRLDHSQLWPVDFKQDMDIDAVIKVAQRDGDQDSLKIFGEAMAKAQQMAADRAKKTVRQILIEENDSRWQREYQALYLRMATVGKSDDYTGADVLAGWYRRNLMIFANLRRSIKPGDRRVLLIIGSGHVPLLRQFIEDSPDLEFVGPGKLLSR